MKAEMLRGIATVVIVATSIYAANAQETNSPSGFAKRSGSQRGPAYPTISKRGPAFPKSVPPDQSNPATWIAAPATPERVPEPRWWRWAVRRHEFHRRYR